jgi:hypothetical protein
MKFLFVGPTLPDARLLAGDAFTICPPARQGDIFKAVNDDANVIGLIDGNFEYTAPIWHKEILFALSLGVRVYGASSMGALRAAECEAFGMIGIGEIFQRFSSREIEDDDAVAQLHAPEELAYQSVTFPKVNIDATLKGLLAEGAISSREFEIIAAASDGLFFKDRTFSAISRRTSNLTSERQAEIRDLLKARYVDQKRYDAIGLIERMKATPDCRVSPPTAWEFHATEMWNRAFLQQ